MGHLDLGGCFPLLGSGFRLLPGASFALTRSHMGLHIRQRLILPQQPNGDTLVPLGQDLVILAGFG